VLDSYGPIRETDIARFLNIDTGSVIAKLKEMHSENVVDYLPTKDAPQMTFTKPRVDAKYLQLNETAINKRKEAQRQRMETMIHYLTSTSQCRSKMLLKYFGEIQTELCGICDVCLERHRLELTDTEFENHVGTVSTILKQQPVSIKELVTQLPQIREDKLLHVTRWLMDVGLVVESEPNKLQWKK
jgi:ATP-dependent DNA helicase RecQ